MYPTEGDKDSEADCQVRLIQGPAFAFHVSDSRVSLDVLVALYCGFRLSLSHSGAGDHDLLSFLVVRTTKSLVFHMAVDQTRKKMPSS